MMTPGQASRIACWISLLTATSHDGRWPLFRSCWRRWMCMMLAPALKAALASRAICSGVTGTLCCFGSVSTPFSAQVMTALSLMDQLSIGSGLRVRSQCSWRIMRPAPSDFLASTRYRRFQPPSGPSLAFGAKHARIAAVDREISRARENRARFQSIEPADLMAEVSRIGISDILCQMRKVEVLIGEVQQMPRAFPGAEGTERDASLLLEQVQEARRGQSSGCSTACRRHRPAGKRVDLRNRPDHARIE